MTGRNRTGLTESGYFNSHPHEEDDLSDAVRSLHQRNFNSHPHEEDDVREQQSNGLSDISTHILTKRMTRRSGKVF